MVTSSACETDGCPQFGVPLSIDSTQIDLETGAPFTISTVVCGGCQQPITGIDGEV